MITQEVKIQGQFSLEVPIEWTKEDMEKRIFNFCPIKLLSSEGTFKSNLEIIDIEEEDAIYGAEEC